ncbi:MAG: protein-methionine-sulfoxide reductase heme-binding subunit MsrQ [Rhodobacterales bacterium]|nr:MAG: protein-methionine-sulfoxide reductase heme-binding subunit MsrQ [Rhodobacterales bacterium]
MTDRLNAAARRLPTWPFYLTGLAVPLWYVYLAASGRLGIEPVEALEHRLGLLGLQFLAAGLMVTPLRRFTGLNLLRFRRMLGLLAFYYIAAHVAVWLVLDVGALRVALGEVVKRPYIAVGMAGFLLLVPLAATSTNAAIRRLGPAWRRLHRLVYPAALLGAAHFVMLRKGWQLEPLVYLGLLALLVGLRWLPKGRSPGRVARA